jgi:hypothetical protein
MLTYDPRTISSHVYKGLKELHRNASDGSAQNEQKSQAVELYTYIATWGLLRLKGEEFALSQDSKRKVVECFFQILGKIAFSDQNYLSGRDGLTKLTKQDDKNALSASEYLGISGLALQIAREFSFWAEAVYPNTSSTPNSNNNPS